MLERTLVVLKPDAICRGLIGEIITRFEKIGLRIAGMKMAHPDKDFYFHHYETIGQMVTRRGQQAFDQTVDFMTTSPVLAIVLEGVEAVELVRKIVGSTEPKSAALGSIRGDYAHLSFKQADVRKGPLPNLVHASGNVEEAALEIKHWFSDMELFHYDNVHQKFTQ